MSVRTAPCDWELENPCPCDDNPAITPAMIAAANEVATEIAFNLSGRRFGLCEVTIRPCGRPCGDGAPVIYGPAFLPFLTAKGWINCAAGDCGCFDSCKCCKKCSIALPGPVDSITSVTIGGAVVDPALYRVDDFRDLVKVDGDCWPKCPDLNAPLTDADTFGVTYMAGIPVPRAGILAAGAYACELAKSCAGLPCSLPSRVTSLTREGVSMAILDPADFLDKGLTGFLQLDTWLRAVNPAGLAQASRVYSPDVNRGSVATS